MLSLENKVFLLKFRKYSVRSIVDIFTKLSKEIVHFYCLFYFNKMFNTHNLKESSCVIHLKYVK